MPLKITAELTGLTTCSEWGSFMKKMIKTANHRKVRVSRELGCTRHFDWTSVVGVRCWMRHWAGRYQLEYVQSDIFLCHWNNFWHEWRTHVTNHGLDNLFSVTCTCICIIDWSCLKVHQMMITCDITWYIMWHWSHVTCTTGPVQ